MGFAVRVSASPPIIHRNTPLPASRSEVFHTVRDDQNEVEIDVYQGESDDVRRNHRVGRFMIQGLAAVPAGNPHRGAARSEPRRHAEGVGARTGDRVCKSRWSSRTPWPTSSARSASRPATVSNSCGATRRRDEDEDEDEELTDGDDAGGGGRVPSWSPGPREGQRETVQARALLEKAERLLERVQPEDRAEVERLMTKVRTALTDRQWDKLTAACNELADTLFYLEDE